MLKLTLKFTLKCSYMFLFNKLSSASLLSCFAKFIIIKIVKHVVMNHFGRVAAYLSRPYWCVYSAQCRVRLVFIGACTVQNVEWDWSLLVRVQCTVQSETSLYWCVYNAQRRVRLVFIGACKMHSAEWDWSLLVRVQCTVQSETGLYCCVHWVKVGEGGVSDTRMNLWDFVLLLKLNSGQL